MRITVNTGATVRIEATAHEVKAVILDHPELPEADRNAEVGRVIEFEGRRGFQPAPFSAYGLSPEVLRAIAQIIESGE